MQFITIHCFGCLFIADKCFSYTHFPANTDHSTSFVHTFAYTTDYKLALWATLVFFVYGSSLQSSAGLLLCLARLVLHSHLEPYRDPVDNLFDCKLAS